MGEDLTFGRMVGRFNAQNRLGHNRVVMFKMLHKLGLGAARTQYEDLADTGQLLGNFMVEGFYLVITRMLDVRVLAGLGVKLDDLGFVMVKSNNGMGMGHNVLSSSGLYIGVWALRRKPYLHQNDK